MTTFSSTTRFQATIRPDQKRILPPTLLPKFIMSFWMLVLGVPLVCYALFTLLTGSTFMIVTVCVVLAAGKHLMFIQTMYLLYSCLGSSSYLYALFTLLTGSMFMIVTVCVVSLAGKHLERIHTFVSSFWILEMGVSLVYYALFTLLTGSTIIIVTVCVVFSGRF